MYKKEMEDDLEFFFLKRRKHKKYQFKDKKRFEDQ